MRISDWSSDVCSSDLARAAREALERTPDQLKALRDAGVVDAGGRGICVILDAAETAMTGRRPMPPAQRQAIPVPLPTNDLTAGGARKRRVLGKRVPVRVDPGGRRCIKTKKKKN